jgi:hypothetical protein
MSFRGQASWGKMVSLRGKLGALACQPTNAAYMGSAIKVDPFFFFYLEQKCFDQLEN